MELRRMSFLICGLGFLMTDVKAISTYFMDENCGKMISTAKNGLGAFKISLTQSFGYSRGLNCQLVVEARPDHQLMFYFTSFDIKYFSYVQNGHTVSGCIDYITLRDGPYLNSPYIKGFTSGICGISLHGDDTIYNSTSQFVTIGFRSDLEFFRWTTKNKGFTLIFTEYHTGTCNDDEFKCPKNGKCIKSSVRCNNFNPCGDETSCKGFSHTPHTDTQKGQSAGIAQHGLDVPTVIGIVVSVGFLIILLVLVVAVIKTRRFQSRPRRCRRRHNISFIDVDSSMTQLRLPSYEEICGGTTQADAPPPYAEEDPNKSNETLTVTSQSNCGSAETPELRTAANDTSETSATFSDIPHTNADSTLTLQSNHTMSGSAVSAQTAELPIVAAMTPVRPVRGQISQALSANSSPPVQFRVNRIQTNGDSQVTVTLRPETLDEEMGKRKSGQTKESD